MVARGRINQDLVVNGSITIDTTEDGALIVRQNDTGTVIFQVDTTSGSPKVTFGTGVTIEGAFDFGSGSNGEETQIKFASTELTDVSGATATASNLIPAGSYVIGVTTRVTTAIGTGNGTTSMDIGDGSDVDLFGNNVGITAGSTTDLSDHTANVGISATATDVVLTAVGGNFDGTGDVRITVHYINLVAPTS